MHVADLLLGAARLTSARSGTGDPLSRFVDELHAIPGVRRVIAANPRSEPPPTAPPEPREPAGGRFTMVLPVPRRALSAETAPRVETGSPAWTGPPRTAGPPGDAGPPGSAGTAGPPGPAEHRPPGDAGPLVGAAAGWDPSAARAAAQVLVELAGANDEEWAGERQRRWLEGLLADLASTLAPGSAALRPVAAVPPDSPVPAEPRDMTGTPGTGPAGELAAAVLAAAPDVIVVRLRPEDGGCAVLSGPVSALLGYPAGGPPPIDLPEGPISLVHPVDRRAALRAYRKAGAAGRSGPVPLRVRQAGGGWQPMVLSLVDLSADPRVGAMIGYCAQLPAGVRHDDTADRAHLRELVTRLNAAVLVEDEHRHVVMVNEAFVGLFGPLRPRQEVGDADDATGPPDRPVPDKSGPDKSGLGESGLDRAGAGGAAPGAVADGPFDPVRQVEELIAARCERPAAALAHLGRLVADGTPSSGERLRLADGRVLEMDFLPRSGSELGALWFLRDVTAEVVARTELEADNLALAEAAEMKSTFVATVSHELRNPLTALISVAQLLLEPDSGRLTEQQHGFVDIIVRNSERMMRLVEDLLLLVRLESQSLSMRMSSVRVPDLLRAAVADRMLQAHDTGVDLSCAAGEGPPVAADPVRLQQVLDNVLGNALKFTSTGGAIAATAQFRDGEWVIAVTDTGIGIPAQEVGRVAASFERGSNAVQRGVAGSGLGLAISRQIMEAHGGTLAVRSELGVGTTVEVAVPGGFPGPARR
jgi:signal transduction histidine kinase